MCKIQIVKVKIKIKNAKIFVFKKLKQGQIKISDDPKAYYCNCYSQVFVGIL